MRRFRRTSWTAFGAAVISVVAVVAGCGPPAPGSSLAASLTPCEQVVAINQQRYDRASPVSQGARTTVVLGDSYAEGPGLNQPRDESWPAAYGQLRHETVWVDAIGGTGFVNQGPCGGQSFPYRVSGVLALHPDLVVIQGGLNDTNSRPDEVSAAVRQMLVDLRPAPQVVVVGPTDVTAFNAGHVNEVDKILSAATIEAGRVYVSGIGWTFPQLSDHIHPNAQGQGLYAQYVAHALDASGVLRGR